MNVIGYDSRLTPYHKPHSTFVAGLHDNPGVDIRFVNNLFVNVGNAREALDPISGAYHYCLNKTSIVRLF